ncbi:hypothetical protein [Streptosporangium sp. NPDC004631]
MFSALSSRRTAATVAGAVLLSLTAACGGSGNTAACAEVGQLVTGYAGNVAAIGTDIAKFNEANQKFSADLKALAGKAEGDLATALNDFSTSWGKLKIDASDPAAIGAAVGDMTKKSQDLQTAISTSCS